MSCTSCTETLPVPECVEEITIGSIELLSTAILIFVKNLTTGAVYAIEAISDSAGLVILETETPDISFYNHNHVFEFWIEDPTDPGVRLTITINSEEYDCLLVPFEKINNSPYTEYTLQI